MNKLIKILTSFIIFLILNGCATLYVNSTIGPGVHPNVKKEMIENEKRMVKNKREIDRGHRQQKRAIEKAQQLPWDKK